MSARPRRRRLKTPSSKPASGLRSILQNLIVHSMGIDGKGVYLVDAAGRRLASCAGKKWRPILVAILAVDAEIVPLHDVAGDAGNDGASFP